MRWSMWCVVSWWDDVLEEIDAQDIRCSEAHQKRPPPQVYILVGKVVGKVVGKWWQVEVSFIHFTYTPKQFWQRNLITSIQHYTEFVFFFYLSPFIKSMKLNHVQNHIFWDLHIYHQSWGKHVSIGKMFLILEDGMLDTLGFAPICTWAIKCM